MQPYTPGARNATAWYATDPDAEHAVLALAADYGHLPAPEAPLADEPDVLALAERWLQAACPQWLMGWRRNARATDERTTIATVMPMSAQGDSVFLWLVDESIQAVQSAALLGNLGCLPLDFVARQKVGGVNFNFTTSNNFPYSRQTATPKPTLHSSSRAYWS